MVVPPVVNPDVEMIVPQVRQEPVILPEVQPVEELMEFSEPSGLKRKLVDYESSSEEETPSPKRYCCPHCSEAFRSYQERKRHIHRDHPETLLNRGSQSSSKEDYFDPEGDALINEAFDREAMLIANHDYRTRATEQVGGRLPLFDFRLHVIGPRRRWRNTVNGAQYRAELIQHRNPTERDDIGVALSEALYRVILQELANHPRARHVNFNITANGLSHAYQSVNLAVADLLQRNFLVDQALRNMAGKLNSNEEFSPEDGFQLDLVFVNHPTCAGRPRKRQVGLKNLQRVFDKKRCIVKIQNEDDSCVAQSIVTMRAWADWQDKKEHCQDKEEIHQAYNDYEYLTRKNGHRKQGELAKTLFTVKQAFPKALAVYPSGRPFKTI